MKTIETLKREHELILEFLNDLQTALKSMEWRKGTDPPPDYFREAISLARDFADKYHHYKEEHVMFALLAQKHSGELDAYIEKLKQQHERNRNLLSQASGAVDGFEWEEEGPAKQLYFSLTEYFQNLRAHIRLEDEIFFPLVDKVMSAEESDQIGAEFKRVETKYGKNYWNESSTMVSNLVNMRQSQENKL